MNGFRTATSRRHGVTSRAASRVPPSGTRPLRLTATGHCDGDGDDGNELRKLTDGTGTREMHTNLLTVMPFQMHTVPGAKTATEQLSQ
jgi:hypothetical protein